MVLSKWKKPSTFLKYLLSYVLVFTVLMAAFFLILRSQLTESYASQRTARIQVQMDAVRAYMNDNFLFLTQTDTLITQNANIRLANYRSDQKYFHITDEELIKYAATSDLIDSIVYYSRYSNHVFSKMEYVTYNEGIFVLTNVAGKQAQFDPAPYMDADLGQLIWQDDGQTAHLFYFPKNQTLAKFIYFYILDTRVLQAQLNTLLSEEVPAVALLDAQGNYVTGSGFAAYIPALENIPLSTGSYNLSDSHSLFLSGNLHSDFSLAVVVSEDYLANQVGRAFMHAFISLLILSLLGIVVVYVSMQLTYRPLQRMVKNLGHEAGHRQNYLEVISEKYSALSYQKAQLEQALAEYREALANMTPQDVEDLDYPHEELGCLSASLREKRFSNARELVSALLPRADGAPGYYLSCVLLDCLTIIANSMSRAHIEHETYADSFAEAVSRCRNIRDVQNFDEIKVLIQELLFLYEQEIAERDLHAENLKQFVESRFCDPEFSISALAETYHLNLPRMSNLFKSEMGIGFMEYVWKKRLEKAQELLRTTNLSVEEIAQSVGYLASTSFSRKFKQETGLTPSQYRSKFAASGSADQD